MRTIDAVWMLAGALFVATCGDSGTGEPRLPENTFELCADGLDNDHNGRTDCDDYECGRIEGVCDTCFDNRDNDANGRADCADSACANLPECQAPDGMVIIRAGSYERGCSKYSSEATPKHTVTLPSYYVDRRTVSVGDYIHCMDASVCATPVSYEAPGAGVCTYGPHPDLEDSIECVTWEAAVEYCEWRGARLCSETEWDYATFRGFQFKGLETPKSWSEFVQDSWILKYGFEHPDGTLELDVPTDGTAYEETDDVIRTTKSTLSDACNNRDFVVQDEPQGLVGFRCCKSTEP